ncbi:hypothetical protein JOE27_004602 [Pseudomonas sp. M5]|nr:hypothetical protein [Pseudomonas sp. M5]
MQYRTSKYDSTHSNIGVATNTSRWMDKSGQCGIVTKKFRYLALAYFVIPDSNDHTIKLTQSLEKIVSGTDNFPTTGRQPFRPNVIEE